MKLADLFNEDNRYKTAMAMSGLGSVLQGNSAAPMMRNMMMFDMQKKESEQEQQEQARQQQARQQANERLQGLFGGGGQTAGGFNSAAPVSMPNESQMIGAETMAALGTENYTPGDKESFVKAMMPHAMRVSQQTGLDPRLVIAQAAQETGWGRSAPNNNFFGIKSHGRDNGARLSTRESIDGQNVQIQDSFRQYGGMGESADDYAQFLQNNPRYQEMLSAPDLQSQIRALGQSGYATDPNYAQSVGSIAQSIGAQGGDRRMAQAGGQTRTDAIDPARAMMILNNPNVSDQAKSYIVDRLKKQNEGGITGRDRYMNVGGQLFDVTGDRPRAVTDDQGQRVTPMTPEQRAQWGVPEDDERVWVMGPNGPDVIGGGGVTTNVNMGGNKFAEQFAKDDATALSEASATGLAARRNLTRIDRLESLLADSPTGLEGALINAAGEFGINTEGLNEVQAATALINSMVPEQRAPGSGPMSDADLAMFKQSLPRIINQPGGNEAILNTMRAIAQYDAQAADIVQSLRSGEIDRAEAFNRLQNRENPLAEFSRGQAAAPGGEQQQPGNAEPLGEDELRYLGIE